MAYFLSILAISKMLIILNFQRRLRFPCTAVIKVCKSSLLISKIFCLHCICLLQIFDKVIIKNVCILAIGILPDIGIGMSSTKKSYVLALHFILCIVSAIFYR